MNIAIAGGTLSSANKGCNALTRGTITALLDNYGPDINIKLLSYSSKKNILHKINILGNDIEVEEIPSGGFYGMKFLVKTLIKPFIGDRLYKNILKKQMNLYDTIVNSKMIFDISEGDSFSDIYGFKRFLIHSNIKSSVIKLNKPLTLLPQTIGPYKNRFIKKKAKQIMDKCEYVLTRDSISYDITVNQMGIDKNKVFLVPDMAFYMNPYDIDLELSSQGETIIGLNVSALLYNGGYNGKNMFGFKVEYKELVDEIIEWALEKDNTKLILVPHVIVKDGGVEDDLEVCKLVYKKYKEKYDGKIYLCQDVEEEHKLKGIISNCDFFIGGRMHACIGAISTQVPTVPTAYSRKFIGIWNDFDLGECVADPRNHSKEEILNILNKSYDNRESIKEILKVKSSNLRNEITLAMKKVI